MSDGQLIKEHGPVFAGYGVYSMATTHDNKWLFAGSTKGHLVQICLESQEVVHDYGIIHGDSIECLQTTRDSKWLLTGSHDGRVQRISIENKEVDNDFGEVSDGQMIRSMKITADGEKLLVGDKQGKLTLISSTDGEVINGFGGSHEYYISAIVMGADEKTFFTSSRDGALKQWNLEDNSLVTDHGNIIDDILCLCL